MMMMRTDNVVRNTNLHQDEFYCRTCYCTMFKMFLCTRIELMSFYIVIIITFLFIDRLQIVIQTSLHNIENNPGNLKSDKIKLSRNTK